MQAGAFVLSGRTNTSERLMTLSLGHKRPMLMLPRTRLFFPVYYQIMSNNVYDTLGQMNSETPCCILSSALSV